MRVGIINYGVGNLGSVVRAVEELRYSPIVIDRAVDLHSADCLILPGVGGFTECKGILDAQGWTSSLIDEIRGFEKPLLGICLGMQLLADVGMEGAADESGTPGLGFIAGTVRSLRGMGCTNRVPHMGWNELSIRRPGGLVDGVPSGTDVYFVHSYAFDVADEIDVIAVTEYGIPFVSVVGKGRVWGTQFHPEKSSKAGFRVLKNFLSAEPC
jgi:glutamine amidotransferase